MAQRLGFEGVRLVYRRGFDFWLKVFALSFGMVVVTGIVMAFSSAPTELECAGGA